MMQRIFLFLLLICSTTCFSQQGGFLGKNHLVGLQYDFHPGGLFAIQNNNVSSEAGISTTKTSLTGLLFTPRLTYEFVLKKGFSIAADVGFKHLSVGEEVGEVASNSGSNLFNSPGSSGGSLLYTKYYISGFDLNITTKFYFFGTSGKIAPLGKYIGIVLGLPNYHTYYRNDIVEKSSAFALGLSYGAQGILFKNVTYDYGIRASYTSPISKVIQSQEIANNVGYSNVPSATFATATNAFVAYFKIAYLL